MCQGLMASLLKNVFSGQPDNTLKAIRDIINKKQNPNEFVFHEVVTAFKGHTTKDFELTEPTIEKLLTTPYTKKSECYLILALIYSLSNAFTMTTWDMDHLHPHNCFEDKDNGSEKLKNLISEEEYKEVMKEGLWNTVLNLQLLDGGLNRSKGKVPLKEFVKDHNVPFLPFPNEATLELKDFQRFIEARKRILTDALKKICSGQTVIS
jgi:hypothetical protein